MVFTLFCFSLFLSVRKRFAEGSSCLLHDGSEGVCKNLNSCQWIIDNLSQRRMSQRDIKLCSFIVILLLFKFIDGNPIIFSYTHTNTLSHHHIRGSEKSHAVATIDHRLSVQRLHHLFSRKFQCHGWVSVFSDFSL